MKVLFILILIMGMGLNETYAHNSKEAFFVITLQENSVEVSAEFPWTFRTALLTYAPALQEATVKTTFEQALFDYVQASLILKGPDQQPLTLLSVQEFNANGHSHQSNFIFEYAGNQVQEVTNTLMFNVSDEQVNYHKLLQDKKIGEFETTPMQPSFVVELSVAPFPWSALVGGIFLVVIMGYLVSKRSSKKSA